MLLSLRMNLVRGNRKADPTTELSGLSLLLMRRRRRREGVSEEAEEETSPQGRRPGCHREGALLAELEVVSSW